MELSVGDNEAREYCKNKGYDFDILIALLDENEIEQLNDEVLSQKNGSQFLDGLLAFPRYAWRNAMCQLPRFCHLPRL